MSDPWKQQVIWQKVVEKETLAYAEIQERNAARLAREAGRQVATQRSIITEQDESSTDKNKQGYEEFNERLPHLPISNGSTGTIHTMHARRADSAIEAEPVDTNKSGPRKSYRHGLAPHFLKRNAAGGFFAN